MSIHDNDGTSSYEIAKIWDNDGTTSHQINKIWDSDGTTSYLIYTAWEDGALFTEGQVSEELGGIKTSTTNGVTVTIESDHIYTKVQMYNGTNVSANIGFVNPINMTNYNTLYALVDYSFPAWSTAYGLKIGTSFGGSDKGYALSYYGAYDGAPNKSGTQEIIQIDISNLSGSYYVTWSGSTTPNSPWIKHYKIWMV